MLASILIGPVEPPRAYREGDMLDLEQPILWTVGGVLTPDECRAQIDRIEGFGFAPAPITTALGA